MNRIESIGQRKQALKSLQNELAVNEMAILDALYADLKKPHFEGMLTEIALVQSELRYLIKNLNKWSRPKIVWPSLANFPGREFVYKEPYGKVLIISPWNYPFLLALSPLISAYAAGNQVVLKPSEVAPNCSQLISKVIAAVFEKSQVEVIEGGVEVSTELLTKRWDYIFFTGSVTIGKIVAKAAANYLTPVTLELGGKSPCIVDQSADLRVAAKRIVWGKFLNAGQTCVAPDYLLVHRAVKNQLVKHLQSEIVAAYGSDPRQSSDLGRIVNQKNWIRLSNLLKGQQLIFGGQTEERECYIAPTIIDEPSLESELMQEEIFGPLLPIISYQNEVEIENILTKFEKPLALYVFSANSLFSENCIQKFAFGGGCVNDVVMQLASKNLPFGGVGHSGMGSYHGKRSFDTFTHHKSIVKKPNWLDIKIRYAPYKGKMKWIKRVTDFF